MARTLPLWEAAFPVMVPTRDPARRTAAARQAAAVHMFDQMKQVAPGLAGIHELDPFGADECHWLLVNTVADYIFDVRWRVPGDERFLAGLVPKAIFVQTYRDVGEVVGSFCSLLSTLRGISSDRSARSRPH